MDLELCDDRIQSSIQSAHIQRIAHDVVLELRLQMKKAKSASAKLAIARELTKAMDSFERARVAAAGYKRVRLPGGGRTYAKDFEERIRSSSNGNGHARDVAPRPSRSITPEPEHAPAIEQPTAAAEQPTEQPAQSESKG